jgi:hypothetical protein
MQYQDHILRIYLGPTPFQPLSLLTTVNWGATKEPPQPPTPSALSRFEGEEGREARALCHSYWQYPLLNPRVLSPFLPGVSVSEMQTALDSTELYL